MKLFFRAYLPTITVTDLPKYIFTSRKKCPPPEERTFLQVLEPASVSDSGETAAVDFGIIDDVAVTLGVVTVASVTPDTTLESKFQESADGSTAWSDCAHGEFPTISEDYQTSQILFRRSKRYVRLSYTISGESAEIVLAVVAGK